MPTDNQKSLILSDLLTGCRITAIDALNRYGCLRLAARVSDLIKDGFPIKKTMIKTQSGKMVAEYYLESENKPKERVDELGNYMMFI